MGMGAVDIEISLLALYTKLQGGRCLTYLGREGRGVIRRGGHHLRAYAIAGGDEAATE